MFTIEDAKIVRMLEEKINHGSTAQPQSWYVFIPFSMHNYNNNSYHFLSAYSMMHTVLSFLLKQSLG